MAAWSTLLAVLLGFVSGLLLNRAGLGPHKFLITSLQVLGAAIVLSATLVSLDGKSRLMGHRLFQKRQTGGSIESSTG